MLLLPLLSSCIAVKQRDVAPVELPANFVAQGEEEVPPDWWLQFGDSGLIKAVNMALSGNFDLLAARDKLLQAQAVARKEGAALVPSLDASGTAKETWSYEDDSSSTTGSYELGLAASYELDLWGRLRFAKEAALLDVKASDADLQTAAITVASEVASVWFEIAESKQQVQLLEEQRDLNGRILEIISTQFKSGSVGFADVLQQKELVESSKGELISEKIALQLLEHQLAVLLGVAPTTSGLPSPEKLVDAPLLPETGVPMDLLLNRPDIRSSFYSLLSADQSAAEAVANRFPKLSISASLYTSGTSARDLFSDWFSSIAANLAAPVFDGGYLKAEADRTEAVASQSFHNYGQTVLDALSEVEAALLQEQEQDQLFENLEIRLKLSQMTVERLGDQYRQGVVDYQRVLSALLSHQNLQKQVLQTKRKKLGYRIQLYRALGGHIDLPEPIAKEN